MELLNENSRKKIYKEDNKIYCMFDMKNYVGYRASKWYKESQEIWRLMSLDEDIEDNHMHIEASIDDQGKYNRILIDIGTVRRVILIDDDYVFSDSIVISIEDDYLHSDRFLVLDKDKYSDKKVPLEKYLSSQQEFNIDGKIYKGTATDNNLVTEFLIKNEELIKLINEEQKNKRKIIKKA